jgi:HPt (histidine-containing phosphotransfer) domain-containing protein
MTNDLIDPSVYADLSEAMGADFAAELITTFLDDAPNIFAELNAAVSSQDSDAYRRAAHSIKSNAQVFGATLLADEARGMELAGLSGSADAVPDLEATYDRTADALKGLLDG